MKKFLAVTLASVAILGTSLPVKAQKWEGLAPTPPMGWSSWNCFGLNLDEEKIRGIADAMVENGLLDAGYTYVNLDDAWQNDTRDENGNILPDPQKFPSGMKALSDYIHDKGLKFGVYSDVGCMTCGGHLGSLGHEYQDALQYARWGVDYLKYDWCNNDGLTPKGAYKLMSEALKATGRPILFSMCEWGNSEPWTWAQDVAHMWRTTNDIHAKFDSYKHYGTWGTSGILQLLDRNVHLRSYAGPDHWNDADMLEVGNGMSVNEDRAHFSMWCMLASPLILGNDIRNMSQETKDIILNKEVIAVDQDPLGHQALRYLTDSGIEYWFKPLVNDEWAFCILNRTLEPREITLDWKEFDFEDLTFHRKTDLGSKVYKIRDLWKHKDDGTTEKNRTITVPGHDVVMYRLSAK